METLFASAERSPEDELTSQAQMILEEKVALNFLDLIPLYLFVLNSNRQIIFANKEFLKLAKTLGHENIIGQRPGEVLNCINSDKLEAGCGTSIPCSVCGAVNAIVSAQNTGMQSSDECRITMKNKESLDLMMYSIPIEVNEQKFIFCAVSDIADQKRRRVLERIFFHDILNTAGGLKSFVSLLDFAGEKDLKEYLEITSHLTDQLIDEIQGQRLLNAAENHELEVNPKPFSTFDMLMDIKLLYENFEVSDCSNILVNKESYDKVIKSDKMIVRRVLGNLTRNALEAVKVDDVVTLSCIKQERGIVFTIHNNAYIERDGQLQIFQRSYTTKGLGHGIGTYAAKLLTERYLNGNLTFSSEKEKGTTFELFIPIE